MKIRYETLFFIVKTKTKAIHINIKRKMIKDKLY